MEVLNIKKRDLVMSKGREKLGGHIGIGCLCESKASLSFVFPSRPPPQKKPFSKKSVLFIKLLKLVLSLGQRGAGSYHSWPKKL